MRIFRLILNRIKLIPGKIRETLKIRLIFLNIMTIALFAVLIIRVYGLQIVETRDEDYVPTGSAVRQVTSRYVESVRGEIYDRKGKKSGSFGEKAQEKSANHPQEESPQSGICPASGRSRIHAARAG